jgi:hypothetical protein
MPIRSDGNAGPEESCGIGKRTDRHENCSSQSQWSLIAQHDFDSPISPYKAKRARRLRPTRMRKKATLHLNVPTPSMRKSWCGNVHKRNRSNCGIVTVAMCRPRTPVLVSPMKQIQQPRTKKAVMRIKRSSQPKRRTMKARAYKRKVTMVNERKQKRPVTPSMVDDMSCSRYSLLCIDTSRDAKNPFNLSMMLTDTIERHERRG